MGKGKNKRQRAAGRRRREKEAEKQKHRKYREREARLDQKYPDRHEPEDGAAAAIEETHKQWADEDRNK